MTARSSRSRGMDWTYSQRLGFWAMWASILALISALSRYAGDWVSPCAVVWSLSFDFLIMVVVPSGTGCCFGFCVMERDAAIHHGSSSVAVETLGVDCSPTFLSSVSRRSRVV